MESVKYRGEPQKGVYISVLPDPDCSIAARNQFSSNASFFQNGIKRIYFPQYPPVAGKQLISRHSGWREDNMLRVVFIPVPVKDTLLFFKTFKQFRAGEGG